METECRMMVCQGLGLRGKWGGIVKWGIYMTQKSSSYWLDSNVNILNIIVVVANDK